MIHIYTDGSAGSGRGKAGWAYLIHTDDGRESSSFGFLLDATCNEAELAAIYAGLKRVSTQASNEEIVVYSDSLNAISWLNGSYKIKAENIQERVIKIVNYIEKYNLLVKFQKVPAHANDQLNNRCDKLAKLGKSAG